MKGVSDLRFKADSVLMGNMSRAYIHNLLSLCMLCGREVRCGGCWYIRVGLYVEVGVCVRLLHLPIDLFWLWTKVKLLKHFISLWEESYIEIGNDPCD